MEESKGKRKFTIKRYQIPTLFNRDFFKQHVKVIRTVLDQDTGLLLSETQVMVNSEEKANLLNNNVKYFLIEEFAYNIKFCEWERKNKPQFVFPLATKVQDVINSLLKINVVKSAAEAIKESLEVLK